MKTSLKKFIILSIISIFLLGFAQLSFGQIASWSLTSNGVASGVDANIGAGNFTGGSGIGSITYAASGARASGWSTGAINSNDYFQVTLSPDAGYTINISDINFGERRSNTGIRDYQVQWSVNADFSSATTIATVNVPDNDSERSGDISSLNIDVADGETIYIRWFGYNAEASGGTWRINNGTLNVNGTVTASSSNDDDSEALAPTGGQQAGGTISSLDDTNGEAVDVFKFDIDDTDSGDSEDTKVTNIRIKPHSTNTADWSDNIQGVKLNGSTLGAITIATTTITDTYIELVITSGNLDAPNGASETMTMSIFLNTSNIEDGETLSFMIDADDHNFTADATGSTFADPFTADVTSSDFTIVVVATQLLFVQQPTNTNKDAAMSPNPTVKACDVNENVDVGYSTAITVTSDGSMTGEPVSGTWGSGVATFSGLTHTVVEATRTLTASSGALANENSELFDITEAPFVYISEFAGKGYGADWNDEYIELTNSGGSSLDLDGWQLLYYEGALERTITFGSGDAIPSNDAFVIAVRTSYTGAISPDYIPSSSFSLNNPGYLVLKDDGGTIIDEAGSSGDNFAKDINYEFTDCSNDNKPVANWDNLGITDGTPGVVNCVATNDTDSEASAPTGGQVAAGTISSINNDEVSEDKVVFKFDIDDTDSGDSEDTKVTKIRIKPHSTNTADWTDNIQGVKLNGSTLGAITIATTTITDTYIDLAITSGNLDVPGGTSETMTMSIYLNTSNIEDGEDLSFMIDADDHGFTADPTGSIFENPFSADVTSSDFEIIVEASELRFVQQPTDGIINVALTPTVTVEATDANGNRDVDYDGASNTITLTSDGCGTATGSTADPVSGLASFPSLAFDRVEHIILTASGSGTPSVTTVNSNSFYITSSGTSNTIKEEDFDGAATWTYTTNTYDCGAGGSNGNAVISTSNTDGVSSTNALTVSYSVSNSGSQQGDSTVFAFSQVTIPASYTNITLSFQVASIGSGTGAGVDARDRLVADIQLDGAGGYSTSFNKTGFSDQLFGYTPDNSQTYNWNAGTETTTAYNKYVINIPDGTTQVDFILRVRDNRTQEYWCIDNILLEGEAPAASNKYYRTTGNANFEEACYWETADDAAFTTNVSDAIRPPTEASRTVTVRNTHTATVTADHTIDELVVDDGGELVVDNYDFTLNDGTGVDLIVNGTLEDNASSGNGTSFSASATWQIGSSGIYIKTNNSSATAYRDNYESGMSNIPADADWIIRYTADNSGNNHPVFTTINSFYPNFTIESNNGAYDMTQVVQKFSGASDYATIKGDFDIGGTGSGTVNVYNINTNAQGLLVMGDFIVRTGNEISIYDGTNTGTGFDLQGNLTVIGTFDINNASSGKLDFTGTNTQIVSGAGTLDIYDAEVDKTSNSVQLDRDLTEINNDLTITDGTLQINAGKFLTVFGTTVNTLDAADALLLKSDASGTASLILNTSSIAATCERYLTADNWHYFFTPLDDADIDILTTTSWGVDNPNFYWYNEPIADYWTGGTLYNPTGWTAPSHAGKLLTNRAYIHQSTENYIYSLTNGDLFQGTKSFTLSYTDNGTGAEPTTGTDWDEFEGWNLFGNPYTAAVDWDNVGIDKDYIENVIYYYDDNDDQYKYYESASDTPYDQGITVNGGSRYIPANQGFFVKAESDGHGETFSIPNVARIHSNQQYWKKEPQKPIPNLIRLQIEKDNFVDEFVIRTLPYQTGVTNEHDGDFDAYKMFSWNNLRPQIYTRNKISTNFYAINSFPEFEGHKIVPIGIYIGEAGEYNINMTENNFENVHVWLEDVYTETNINLIQNPIYTFSQSAQTNNKRFYLHFGENNPPVLNTKIPDQNILVKEKYLYIIPQNMFTDEDYQDVITITANLSSGEALPKWLSFENGKFSGTPSMEQKLNIRVTATDIFGESAYDDFVLTVYKNATQIQSLTGEIIIYPNPTSGIINILLDNNQIQNTVLEIHDASGKIIQTKEVQNNNTEIDLTGYAKGIYLIVIKNNVNIYRKTIILN